MKKVLLIFFLCFMVFPAAALAYTSPDPVFDPITRRIVWTQWPEETYRIVVRDPYNRKSYVDPSAMYIDVPPAFKGAYTFDYQKENGSTIIVKQIFVKSSDDGGGGGGSDPGSGSGSDPGSGSGSDPGSGSGSDPGGGTNPVTIYLGYDVANGKIVWSSPPSSAVRLKLYKDGVFIGQLSTSQNSYEISDPGRYTIQALDANDNIVGQGSFNFSGSGSGQGPGDDPGSDPGSGSGSDPGTDPGGDPSSGGPCTDECQKIMDVLDCPAFEAYLGKWSMMIRDTLPPPPDWHQVAAIMTDHIVPAMGQEIVNRSPEIARIIADELQRREKPVTPPPSVSDYVPPQPLPQMQDIPSKIPFDVESNTPDFTPSYAESKPFIITDPAAVQLDDHDSGYNYPDKTNDSSPAYESTSEIEPDKGYQGKPSQNTSSPAYKVDNQLANDPGPQYYYINGGQTKVPIYRGNIGPAAPAPDYQSGETVDIPDYKP